MRHTMTCTVFMNISGGRPGIPRRPGTLAVFQTQLAGLTWHTLWYSLMSSHNRCSRSADVMTRSYTDNSIFFDISILDYLHLFRPSLAESYQTRIWGIWNVTKISEILRNLSKVSSISYDHWTFWLDWVLDCTCIREHLRFL